MNESMAKIEALTEFVERWRETWRSADGKIIPEKGALTRAQLCDFAEDLQAEILRKFNFRGPSNSTLVLYSGLPMSEVDLIEKSCFASGDAFYTMRQTDADLFWDEGLRKEIEDVIDDEVLSKRFLEGKNLNNMRLGNIAVEGEDFLALDDFVSKMLAKVGIQNGGDVIFVAGNGLKTNLFFV